MAGRQDITNGTKWPHGARRQYTKQKTPKDTHTTTISHKENQTAPLLDGSNTTSPLREFSYVFCQLRSQKTLRWCNHKVRWNTRTGHNFSGLRASLRHTLISSIGFCSHRNRIWCFRYLWGLGLWLWFRFRLSLGFWYSAGVRVVAIV